MLSGARRWHRSHRDALVQSDEEETAPWSSRRTAARSAHVHSVRGASWCVQELSGAEAELCI